MGVAKSFMEKDIVASLKKELGAVRARLNITEV
jgi:hypothetical protein